MHSYDGRCARLWRSVHTVGCFTDGHGRAALTAFPGLKVNGRAGRASPVTTRQPDNPAVRAPSRASRPSETGDRRQCSPRGTTPGRPPALRITKISGTVGINDAVTERPPAPGPLPRWLSRNVADNSGWVVPNPPLPNIRAYRPRDLSTQVSRVRTAAVYPPSPGPSYAGQLGKGSGGLDDRCGAPLRPPGCSRIACGDGPAGRPGPRRPLRPLGSSHHRPGPRACPARARHPSRRSPHIVNTEGSSTGTVATTR